jgi:hypothetical protein
MTRNPTRKRRWIVPWPSASTERFSDGAEAFKQGFANGKPFFGPVPRLKKKPLQKPATPSKD